MHQSHAFLVHLPKKFVRTSSTHSKVQKCLQLFHIFIYIWGKLTHDQVFSDCNSWSIFMFIDSSTISVRNELYCNSPRPNPSLRVWFPTRCDLSILHAGDINVQVIFMITKLNKSVKNLHITKYFVCLIQHDV